MSRYVIEAVKSAPFGQISYLIWLRGQPAAVVIDPGFDTASIVRILEEHSLSLAAILNTHGHVDHIAGNASLKEAFPDAPIIIGRNEATLLDDPDANLSRPFGLSIPRSAADRLVDDGEILELAGIRFEVREIPGHSPGSVVYISHDFDPAIVFGGDVLFAGSVGRTDMGGDTRQLLSGIQRKLFDLPDETTIFPGHGRLTTIGVEKRSNPYVGESVGTISAEVEPGE